MKKQPDFMVNATNVYRTQHFIVRQRIGVLYSISDHNVLYSRDTYYARTPERNAAYESLFSGKSEIDGKRIAVAVYLREYRS